MTNHVFEETPGGGLRLVGDFDGLYSDEADPWGQSGRAGPMASYYADSRSRLSNVLSRLLPLGASGLEVGCGHGYVTEHLRDTVGGIWSGCDISPVATSAARALHSGISFFPADIASSEFPFLGSERKRYLVVILSQLFWYILVRLGTALQNADAVLQDGGLLVLHQAFLRGEQRYGAEIANGFEGALDAMREALPSGYTLLHAEFDDTGRHQHDDGLIIFRKVPL